MAALFLCIASPAFASVTLEYTGNPFTYGVNGNLYQVGAHVSGFITLDAPLAANLSSFDVSSTIEAFSFSDDSQVISGSFGFSIIGDVGLIAVSDIGCNITGCPIVTAWFSTDATGNITGWYVGVRALPVSFANTISTVSLPPSNVGDAGYHYSAGSGGNSDTPGIWSVTANVPEPATWAIFLIGLGVAGFALRRNRVSAVAG